MEVRDAANARLEALRERADAFEAAGEKIPDHLARLLKEAEKAGGKKRTEMREEPAAKPKATTRKTRDGTGYFYEDGHGVEPKHADSTDSGGYPVPRPDDAPGADPQPDYATSDFDAVEPVEKYPDFANPHKGGDQVPDAAIERGTVPDHLKGSVKTMEQVKEEREEEAAKAAVGKPVDPAKAQNPAPDPHQLKVAGVDPKADEKKAPAKKAEPKGKPEPAKTQAKPANK